MQMGIPMRSSSKRSSAGSVLSLTLVLFASGRIPHTGQ